MQERGLCSFCLLLERFMVSGKTEEKNNRPKIHGW